MITIEDILRPEHVLLDFPPAATAGEITFSLEQCLKGDARVLDWEGFLNSLRKSPPCLIHEAGLGISIPHTRTNNVSSMIMSAGRVKRGVFFPESDEPVHYIFVIGVPIARASDYLRIIGALTRTFRSPECEQMLRQATSAGEFLSILSRNENAL